MDKRATITYRKSWLRTREKKPATCLPDNIGPQYTAKRRIQLWIVCVPLLLASPCQKVGSDYTESGLMRRRWDILRMVVQATMDKGSKEKSG
ncbi:hypothetical protein GQ600_1902 [Phytophthora cactorum]|nr:hypothetical protein GQ600_1902 [Phytophthora cactorum]